MLVAVQEFWWMRLSIVLLVAQRTCPDGEDLLDAESTVTLFI